MFLKESLTRLLNDKGNTRALKWHFLNDFYDKVIKPVLKSEKSFIGATELADRITEVLLPVLAALGEKLTRQIDQDFIDDLVTEIPNCYFQDDEVRNKNLVTGLCGLLRAAKEAPNGDANVDLELVDFSDSDLNIDLESSDSSGDEVRGDFMPLLKDYLRNPNHSVFLDNIYNDLFDDSSLLEDLDSLNLEELKVLRDSLIPKLRALDNNNYDSLLNNPERIEHLNAKLISTSLSKFYESYMEEASSVKKPLLSSDLNTKANPSLPQFNAAYQEKRPALYDSKNQALLVVASLFVLPIIFLALYSLLSKKGTVNYFKSHGRVLFTDRVDEIINHNPTLFMAPSRNNLPSPRSDRSPSPASSSDVKLDGAPIITESLVVAAH